MMKVQTFHPMKNFWRVETGIFLGIWLMYMVAGRGQLIGDPGTFWHIVVGQKILSSGQLIYTDPFSFTFGGKPWLAHGWLFDCFMALIHKIGGLDSVLLITVTILASLYTWVASRLIHAGIHWLVSVFITVFTMAASSYHFHARPHLITIVLLGWTFSRLCNFESGRISVKRLFWLLPLYIVWTNIHGGIVGGVVTIGMAVMGWFLFKLLGKETPISTYRNLIPLGGLVIASVLTAYINPFGAELPRLWFGLFRSPVLPQLIQEHAPLYARPTEVVSIIILLFGVFYVTALAGVLPKWPRITWLIPIVWLFLSITRVRHGPLFAITATIALAQMFPHIRWVTWLTRHGSELLRVSVPHNPRYKKRFDWRPTLIPFLVVATAVLLQGASVQFPVMGKNWVVLDQRHYPLELLPELKKYESLHGTPIFNEMLFGGFLIYFTPGLRVFIDDRCELYGDKWLIEYAHAIEQEPSKIDQWAKEYGFDIALTIPDSGFDRYLGRSKEWIVVQREKAANLYQKITNTNAISKMSLRGVKRRSNLLFMW